MEKSIKKPNTVNYIIVLLYLFTMLIPSLGAFDFAATQWFYLGILNIGVVTYYFLNPKYWLYKFPKQVKFLFGILLATILVSGLSMTQSFMLDASLLYLSRIITFVVCIFNLYLVFRQEKGFSFLGLSLIVSFFLFIESIEIVYYFTSNAKEVRTEEFILGMYHRYGNQNILASAVVIKLSFLLFIYFQSKGLKRIFSLVFVLIAIISLFLMGARTSAFIMAIVLVLFSIAYFIVSKYSFKKSVKAILPLVIVAFMAFGYSLSINKVYSDKFNTYTDIFFTKSEQELYSKSKKSNLTNSSGRGKIWATAIKDFEKSPIIGVGLGNWRHNDKNELFINYNRKELLMPTNVHNDFLQVLAETGIIGFILYISLYIICFVLLIKRYTSLKTDYEKLFLVAVFLTLLSYMIDAFFNFPHHRAPIQVVFALIIAVVLGISKQHTLNDKSFLNNKFFKIFGVIAIVLLIINAFNHYRDYKASTIQKTIMAELKTKDAFTEKFKYSYPQIVSMLPDYPYVNQIGITNDDIKAMYALNSKMYNKAIKHLDTSIVKTKNNMWPKTLKAMLYNNRKIEDSAYAYSKEVFDIAPSVESNFFILKELYKKREDTVALFDLYDRHFEKRPKNIHGWIAMCNDIRRYYRNDSLALSKINIALESFPYDENLLKFKSELDQIMSKKSKSDIIASKLDESLIEKMTEYFQEGNKFFSNKDYANARVNFLKVLEIEPNNLPTHFKLGLLENLTKNYKKAIPYFTKVIDDKYLDNGRPEYSRGVSYLKLNNMVNAKKDFLVSRQKGWQAALNLNDSFFK